MFPTGVGMNRTASEQHLGCLHVPHRRGDEPVLSSPTNSATECSPQAWGRTGHVRLVQCLSVMFPTGVGMNRNCQVVRAGRGHVPHRRGDEPGWHIIECPV